MSTRRLGAVGAFSCLLAACGQATPQPDGGSSDSGFTLALTSVVPNQGPLDGGTAVTLTGNGFGLGLNLFFGDAGAVDVVIQSGTTLTAVTPPGAAGTVDVTVSAASGAVVLPDAFTYTNAVSDAGLPIAYCAVNRPLSLAVTEGQQAGPVYGWVYVPGVTDQGTTAGVGITAQVGFGAVGSTPNSSWSWASAAWDAKVGTSGHNDEYNGLLPAAPSFGTFDYAVRFSRDNGNSWTACDTGGDTPSAPYSPSKAGVLTVSAPNPTGIYYCVLHFPTTLSADVGQPAGPVYGWVYVPGVTDQDAGPGPGITGQLGEGPLGSTPDGTWNWIPAAWDAKQGPGGHNDEYEASLPPQGDAGVFAYAYRFEIDGGTQWAYCDTAGDTTYLPANQGVLTVVVDAGPVVDFCNFQYPAALLGEAFTQSTPVYGEVYELGITDDAGQGPGITGQAGIGPLGSDPTVSGGSGDAGWLWFSAGWFAKAGTGNGAPNNDEYAAELALPDAGTYAMVYRFALNGGAYRYCDSAGDAIYTPANQAVLTVVPPTLTVGWCDLQFPASLSVAAGANAGVVYGQVYKQGVTDSAGQGGDILAELGVGPVSGDPTSPSSGFTWVSATYDGDRNGNNACGATCPNDEYNAALIAPTVAGDYAYYFRFSEDDGKVWTVCGYQNPISQGGVAGALTVTGDAGTDAGVVDAGLDAGTDAGVDAGLDGGSDAGALPAYCIFQYPGTLLGETGAVTTNLYGVVYQPGVTDDAGQGPGIAGDVGVGPLGGDPATDPTAWTWTPASYFSDFSGIANDEYAAQITLPAVGNYALAYRFNLSGGPYLYCDTAGDATYAASNQAVATVVAAPLTVGWCDVQFPAALTSAPNTDAGVVYGQVYKQGVTDSMGQGADILAQLGVGPHGADPTAAASGFTWVAAAYDGDRNGASADCTSGCANDEYAAPLVVPSDAGTYDYYFRFTEDNGSVWTVCGYQNPIALGGDAGLLTAQ